MTAIFTHPVTFHASPTGFQLHTLRFQPGSTATSADTLEIEAGPTAEEETAAELEELRGLVTNLFQQLQSETQSRATQQQQILDRLADETMELAFAVASHVVQKSLDAGTYDLHPIVRAAIEELLPSDQFVIHLHPEDLEQLSESLSDQWLELRQEVDLREDPTLERGACRVANQQHALVSTPEIRLENAKERLMASTSSVEEPS